MTCYMSQVVQLKDCFLNYLFNFQKKYIIYYDNSAYVFFTHNNNTASKSICKEMKYHTAKNLIKMVIIIKECINTKLIRLYPLTKCLRPVGHTVMLKT